MKARTQRLLAIRRVIEEGAVSSQDELLKELRKDGFNLTQATLSRDLKFLQAGKRPDKNKGYVYILPGNNGEPDSSQSAGSFPLGGYVSIDFAHNLSLIKTLPGYAASIATAIDAMNAFEILGTLAGDDTILLVPREGVSREDVINVLAVILPLE